MRFGKFKFEKLLNGFLIMILNCFIFLYRGEKLLKLMEKTYQKSILRTGHINKQILDGGINLKFCVKNKQ